MKIIIMKIIIMKIIQWTFAIPNKTKIQTNQNTQKPNSYQKKKKSPKFTFTTLFNTTNPK
jgi:lipopolysaccharide export system protein LptC